MKMMRIFAAICLAAACFLCIGTAKPASAAQAPDPASIRVPCADTDALIKAIHTANASPAEDTIHLAAGCLYRLDAPLESGANGANGLPVISAPLRIEGHGAMLERPSGSSVIEFRFFEVAENVSLRIHHLTMRGGGGIGVNRGGAIYSAGMLTLTDSTLQENTAIQGGALYLEDTSRIEGSLFWGNFATAFGGAIAMEYAEDSSDTNLEIINTTLNANRASNGFALITTGNTRIVNSTIAANYPDPNIPSSLWAVYFAPFRAMRIANSIIDNGVNRNCSSPVIDDGGNLKTLGDSNCGTGFTAADARLAPLQDNGGPTLTMALAPDSPAIGAGQAANCPTIDQRGAPRPDAAVSGCDSGAYEALAMVNGTITTPVDSAAVGEPVSVEIVLVNNTGQPINYLGLVGGLPSGLTTAASPEPTSTCAGNFSVLPHSQDYSLTGSNLAAGESCTVGFQLVGTQPGQYALNPGTITTGNTVTYALHDEADFVVRMNTTTTVQCCAQAAAVGQPVVFSVQVTSEQPFMAVPMGKVSYQISAQDKSEIWNGQLAIINGKAAASFVFDRPGKYNVAFSYGGCRLYNSSMADNQVLTVKHRLFISLVRK